MSEARQFLESKLKEKGIDEEPTFNQIAEIMDAYKSTYQPSGPWKMGGTNDNYDNYGNLHRYSTAVFDEIECVARSMALSYDESIKRAELIAKAPELLEENERLNDKLRLADKNCELLRGNRDELLVDNDRLTVENERMKRVISDLQDDEASELDRLREENEYFRDWIISLRYDELIMVQRKGILDYANRLYEAKSALQGE